MPDMPTMTFKSGEAREAVSFTITHGADGEDQVALDVSSATLTLTVRLKSDSTTALFTKSDGDITKTASTGVVTVDFSAADLASPGQYVADIKIQYSATDIRKTEKFNITIEDAVT